MYIVFCTIIFPSYFKVATVEMGRRRVGRGFGGNKESRGSRADRTGCERWTGRGRNILQEMVKQQDIV